MADGFSHRNVTLGIELYFDDVERAAAYHSRPGRAGGWPTRRSVCVALSFMGPDEIVTG
jgi:hypothetical protein